ncbi:MAG: hypothetical protein JNM24_07000 [Bdellovibrionaceae bacterium]|nr:hypothetical protein [Pseudobdellovibrionaceae bacterium]
MKSLVICILFSTLSFAYIPPLKMILDRTSENAGSGVYSIETDVLLTDGINEANVKESWLVENERSIRLTVIGQKELKGLKLTYLYENGLKWAMKGQKRESQQASVDFLERWHHIRNADALNNFLISNKIIPEYKKDKQSRAVYEESYVRLGRTEGVVNYAIGENNKDSLLPKLWIEQDFFVIRKLRLPSQVEVEFENYKSYSKGLNYPKNKLVRWGQNKVTINTLSVVPKTGNLSAQFNPQSLEANNQSEVLYNNPLKNLLEEFYTRFR